MLELLQEILAHIGFPLVAVICFRLLLAVVDGKDLGTYEIYGDFGIEFVILATGAGAFFVSRQFVAYYGHWAAELSYSDLLFDITLGVALLVRRYGRTRRYKQAFESAKQRNRRQPEQIFEKKPMLADFWIGVTTLVIAIVIVSLGLRSKPETTYQQSQTKLGESVTPRPVQPTTPAAP